MEDHHIARLQFGMHTVKARFGGVTQRIQMDDEWFEGMSDDDIRALVAEIRKI